MAADLGAWGVFEDESGQGLRPPKGRTWGRRGHTPVVRVTAANSPRLSLAALLATRPGHRPRLIYRTHTARRSNRRREGRRGGRRKGLTEADYAALLDAAHRQPSGPIRLASDHLNPPPGGRVPRPAGRTPPRPPPRASRGRGTLPPGPGWRCTGCRPTPTSSTRS